MGSRLDSRKRILDDYCRSISAIRQCVHCDQEAAASSGVGLMLLTKLDYQNILKMLEVVPVTGLESAKLLAVIGHKLETRITAWDDSHATGFDLATRQDDDIPF